MKRISVYLHTTFNSYEDAHRQAIIEAKLIVNSNNENEVLSKVSPATNFNPTLTQL